MSADLIILSAAGALALLTLYLRTNISLGILALGIGYLLADLATSSLVSTMIRLGVSPADWPVSSMVSITLSVVPSLLILVRFRRFQSGRFFEHLFPAIFLALLMTLLILIQLPLDTQSQLSEQSYIFGQFEYFRTAIVLGAAVIAIFDVMVHEQKLKRKAKRGIFAKRGD